MRTISGGAVLFLALTSLTCSEGPELLEQQEATQVMELVRERFAAVKPMLDRGLKLERVEEGFKPVIPDELLKQAPGHWRTPGPHKLGVTLPATSKGATRISSGPVTIEVTPVGIRDVPAAVGEKSVVYADAYPHADTFHVAEVDRVEEFILLRDERAPRRFEYEIKVVRGGGKVRQLEPGSPVEVLDEEGNAWLRLAPLAILDSKGRRHLAKGQLSSGRLEIELPNSVTQFPVLVDPGWTSTGKMTLSRSGHTAIMLNTGKVFVLAGEKMTYVTAEEYNPSTETWTALKSTALHRWGTLSYALVPSATLLGSGKVLAVGCRSKKSTTVRAQIYDPSSGSWTTTSKPTVCRERGIGVLLDSGKVLVAGGCSPGGWPTYTSELYDPILDTWTTTGSLNVTSMRPGAVKLTNSGKVLVVAGVDAYSSSSADRQNIARIYDPKTGTWSIAPNMVHKRGKPVVIELHSGKVLVTGGGTKASELYTPWLGTWSSTGSLYQPLGDAS